MTELKDPLTVWGVGTTRTLRVHWMLHELDLPYRTERIESRTGETNTPDFQRLNPKQKIPCLTHGELVITESYAIIHYLRSLSDALPFDAYQRSIQGKAKYDEWISFILMELDATSLYVVRRHKDLPELYGDAPAAVASSVDYFTRMLDSVADEIKPHDFIWGSTFSEVDVLMAITLLWAGAVGIAIPDHIQQYQQWLNARPTYITALKHNFKNLQIPPKPQS
jgi:glutathione S-transferase